MCCVFKGWFLTNVLNYSLSIFIMFVSAVLHDQSRNEYKLAVDQSIELSCWHVALVPVIISYHSFV